MHLDKAVEYSNDTMGLQLVCTIFFHFTSPLRLVTRSIALSLSISPLSPSISLFGVHLPSFPWPSQTFSFILVSSPAHRFPSVFSASQRPLSLLQRNLATYHHPALHTCKDFSLYCQLLSFFRTKITCCFQFLLSELLPLPPSS